MVDLFTVKLDLSSVTQNENDRLYILLLDPTKMKMIYQFKLWIRFLFSIDCSIKLVYEDAIIHDLEDTNILKLLKVVQVECADSAVGEREQHEELIAKLNRYEEWRESVTPTISPQKQCQIMNGDNFQTSSNQLHDLGSPKIKSSELNLSNERLKTLAQYERNETSPQYSSYTSSQRILNVKNESRNKMRIKNDTFNTSPRSVPYDETDIGNGFLNELSSQKYNTSQAAVTPRSVTQSAKTSNKTSKQSSCERRSLHKPFSLYNFLQTLKGQESNFDEANKVKCDNPTETDKSGMPEKKLNGEICTNEEDEEQLIKRKRKRIRKHKNQRFKVNQHAEFYKEALNSPFHEKQKFMAASVSPKAKHIRFDADEDSGEYIMNKSKQDESLVMNDHTNECPYNSRPELSNDSKFDMTTSNSEVGYVDETNNAVFVTVEINKNIQENSENDCVDKDASVTGDDDGGKNGALSHSSRSVLDILGSLRKKSNTPPVFDRFATCV